ncbi:MAG: PAS domain-containing protein [Betaproteobacteria bacterium]
MNSSVSPELLWHQTTIESALGVGTQGWTQNVARTAAALTLLIGIGALIGWAFGIEALKTGWSGLPQIKANTALSLTLLGVALCTLAFAPAWSNAQITARSIVWIVVAIVSITLVEYILDPAFNIDQILFVDHSGPAYPGRMGLNTATCLLLLSSALLLSRSGSARCSVLSQVLAFLAFMIAMTSAFGYLLNVSALTGVASFTLMALHTSIGLLATAIAIWFLQPGLGLMPILTNNYVSGRVVRALLISVFVLTPLLALLRLRGQQMGYYGTEFGLAIFALSQLCVLTMLTVAVGGLMLRFDIQRLRAELAQHNLMRQLRDSANLAERQVQLRTQELQSSESRLRMVLDNAPALIGYVDSGLRYIFCNHTYREWYGREPASCIGKTVQQIVGYEAWQQIAFNYDHALAGSRISYERRISKGDTHRDVLVDLMPDVRPDEGVLGVFIVGRDNTARRGAEAALAQREAWLRLVSDNSTACIGYVDADEVFRFCNRTYQEWYGLDPAASEGMPLRKLIGDAAYAEVGGYYQRAIAGQRTNYERVLKRGDVVREIAIDLIPDLRENGHIAGVFISGVDITARLVHERALQESNERFRTAFDFAPIGKAIVSLEGQ